MPAGQILDKFRVHSLSWLMTSMTFRLRNATGQKSQHKQINTFWLLVDRMDECLRFGSPLFKLKFRVDSRTKKCTQLRAPVFITFRDTVFCLIIWLAGWLVVRSVGRLVCWCWLIFQDHQTYCVVRSEGKPVHQIWHNGFDITQTHT